MKIGDLIRFRFPFPVDGYVSSWRYGIVVGSCDKLYETIEVLSSGQIIKVHEQAIEIQQKITY